MNRLILLSALVVSLVPAAARAQVDVRFQVALPVAPPLVTIQPGIQVVENYDEEVFFTGGYYWVRRDAGWYRARGPRAAFVFVQPRRVPPGLVRLPPGQYKHWRKAEAKAERRDWKEHQKAERRERKAERREEHGHGHGHGHD